MNPAVAAATGEPGAGLDVEELRTLALALAESLANGSGADAERQLARLAAMHQAELYAELGRLARDLHASLQDFAVDDRIAELAECELPDAQARLDYVNQRSEDAAHRTLAATEQALPLVHDLGARAEALDAAIGQWRGHHQVGGELGDLLGDLEAFLGDTRTSAAGVAEQLNEIMLAQEFQDLTGQVLRRVTELVREMEGHLVGLLRAHGAPARARPQAVSGLTAEGPAVAGGGARVQGQDEVDDLLSDLGF